MGSASNGYELNKFWNGEQRVSPEWCKMQAKAISNVIDKDIDSVGLITLLNEMANRDYKTAERGASEAMEHLLYSCAFASSEAVNHWLSEVRNFIKLLKTGLDISKKNKKGSTLTKNDLKDSWEEIYADAVEATREKASHITGSFIDLSKIPKTAPWTLEDFLEKSVDELRSMVLK